MGRTYGKASRLGLGVAAAAAALAVGGGTLLAATALLPGVNPWPYAGTPPAPVLAAVGDIACQPRRPARPGGALCTPSRNQGQLATANQIERMRPDLVAILGDEQYRVGRYEDFMGSYDPTYGAFKYLQRPAPGNHEFYDAAGATGVRGDGYFSYFNGYQLRPDGSRVTDTFTGASGTVRQPRPRRDGQAGRVGNGWYSYDLGSWHVVSLNAECAVRPGGCNVGGAWLEAETRWLARDLAGDRDACTLAYWHQPTFNAVGSTASPEGRAADAWWKLLYAHGADVVLNAHDHVYARFAPMNPDGAADPARGIREFVVGTGGESLDTLAPSSPNRQAAADGYYGVLALTLGSGSYRWDFESALRSPAAPASLAARYGDTGSAACHGTT